MSEHYGSRVTYILGDLTTGEPYDPELSARISVLDDSLWFKPQYRVIELCLCVWKWGLFVAVRLGSRDLGAAR